jgi:hypothetical protein
VASGNGGASSQHTEARDERLFRLHIRGRVDLEHGMVEVAEIVTEVSGYLHFGPPKTRAGYRRVGLPRVVVEALAEQLAPPGSADALVLVGPQGGTLRLAGFRPDLAVWLVGVTGLEPVTSSL